MKLSLAVTASADIIYLKFCFAALECLVKHQSPGLLHALGSPFVGQSYDRAEILIFSQINGGSKTLVVPGQIMEGLLLI
jgi:hypothetical protein